MSTPRHYLITGGAGFIGSHLTERLLAEGERVTIVDDLSSGASSNLSRVMADPRLRFIESKVSACSGLDRLVADSDFVFHLAAAVGVEMVVKAPIHTIEINLNETASVLEAASQRQKPVLLTSTSEVYGKSQKAIFSEEDDLLIGPPWLSRWSYACSKLTDEFLAFAHAQERRLPVIVVRVFNTVGPRQIGRYGMVLPRFIEAAAAAKPLLVYGDGQQTRCFSYVADTVEALVRLSRSERARGEVFNVGGDEEVSIIHLAELIVDVLQSASAIQLLPYSEAYAPGFEDMRRRRPDLRKLESVIGFRPSTPLEQIVRLTASSRV